MLKFNRFEEIPVWRSAVELAVRILDWGRGGAFRGHPGLRDQIERAVISISNNIAEGYERGTHEELITFLYYARGSAGEVRSMLAIFDSAEEWAGEHEAIREIRSLSLSVSRQLGGWIESVKNSDNPGDRYHNDATRRARGQSQRQSEFLDYLRDVQDRAARSIHTTPRDPKDSSPSD